MNRILLDQGLAPHTAAIPRRNGLDAVHVSEIGMEQAEDIQIMEKARIDERVCVTLGHDFSTRIWRRPDTPAFGGTAACPGT
jgi:predicted nuclease of predicted toxin-antitoxin system